MFDREPRLRTILQINLRFVCAVIVLLYGWACWQWVSPEWWGLAIPAIFCLLAGTIQVIATVQQIVAIFARERKIDAYKEQGGKVRADRMASERDLKDRGMIR